MAEATEAALAGPTPPRRLRAALGNARVLFGGAVLAALFVLAVGAPLWRRTIRWPRT